MNNKGKVIVACTIIAVLAALVAYVNWPSGSTGAPVSAEADRAIQEQIEHAKNNPTPEPDLSRLPEESRKPGGRSAGR